jgi:hypothetical protein
LVLWATVAGIAATNFNEADLVEIQFRFDCK